MKIWYSTYQLFPQYLSIQQSKNKFRHGALLRVRLEDGSVGYSDICPFPDMGDRPLELELKQLSVSKPTNLGERALYFAQVDAAARAAEISLYDPTIKIKNHFLISDIQSFDPNRIEKLETAGFTEFKIKLGRELESETKLLFNLIEKFSSSIKVRLDFNAQLSRDRFVNWFEGNHKWLRPFLEFIEDPFIYNAKEWREVAQRWNIQFALDLAADPIATECEGAPIVVVKPAVQDVDRLMTTLKNKNKKFVFTHYMDFPVGQMFALVSAQKYFNLLGEQLLTCGLQHHDLYQGITFQEEIRADGPFILPPIGKGIGFDGLLGQLTWTELI